MNGLKIAAVAQESTASELGLLAGDVLVRIGDKPVRDIIDYHFLLATEQPVLTVRRGESEFCISLGDDTGLTGLSFTDPFGRIRCCTNRCLFCFVDQQPAGLRPSLCFKDDDYRLSFWEGNFITLTNATQEDLERIVRQRLSPLYVSVHTTNPELRVKMLGNPRAAEIDQKLRVLAAGGIVLHTQVVLCPGLNDREELSRTVADLAAFYPAVQSVAIVPVGLTRHREGLYPLRPVTQEEAAEVLQSVAGWQDRYQRLFGSRIVFAADEFYLLAGKPVPAAKEYEGFPQLENGVGLVRRFLDTWARIEKRLPPETASGRIFANPGRSAAYFLEDRLEKGTARKQQGGGAERTSGYVSGRTLPVDKAGLSLSPIFRKNPGSEPYEPGKVLQRSCRRAVVVTGEMFKTVLAPVISRLNRIRGLEVELLAVTNRFFGSTVSVAGLLTGTDVEEALRGIRRPDVVIVPAAALKERRLFLDGMSCEDLAGTVGCPVVPAEDPREMVTALGLKFVRRSLTVHR
ncbi:MAG: DUF512 domain-containing protein [Bacillota bacterium]